MLVDLRCLLSAELTDLLVIHQLAELFRNLEYSETPSVTPSIELAKLALVTSKDEEDEEADKGGTDSSNDTDATLVDDGTSRYASEPVQSTPESPVRSPSSVLGKRSRDLNRERSKSDMDIDADLGPSLTRTSYSAPTLQASSSKLLAASASSASLDADGDVIMRSNSPIHKKATARKPEVVRSDSVMMFGNCPFNLLSCMY